MCSVLPCVAEVLDGRSRWQLSLGDLLAADIPAVVTSWEGQWRAGTVSGGHTGAFVQHLGGKQ